MAEQHRTLSSEIDPTKKPKSNESLDQAQRSDPKPNTSLPASTETAGTDNQPTSDTSPPLQLSAMKSAEKWPWRKLLAYVGESASIAAFAVGIFEKGPQIVTNGAGFIIARMAEFFDRKKKLQGIHQLEEDSRKLEIDINRKLVAAPKQQSFLTEIGLGSENGEKSYYKMLLLSSILQGLTTTGQCWLLWSSEKEEGETLVQWTIVACGIVALSVPALGRHYFNKNLENAHSQAFSNYSVLHALKVVKEEAKTNNPSPKKSSSLPESLPPPEVQMPEQLPAGYQIADVPADNNCLFWSAALGLLLPLLGQSTEEQEQFNSMFDRLFGTIGSVRVYKLPAKEVTVVPMQQAKEHVRAMLIAYDYKKETPAEFEGGSLIDLICNVFRNRVVDKLSEVFSGQDKAAICAEAKKTDWSQYVASMRNPVTWGGNPEIHAIAALAKKNIQVLSVGQKPIPFTPSEIEGSPLYLVHTNVHGHQRGEKNHYNFCYLPPSLQAQKRSEGTPALSASSAGLFATASLRDDTSEGLSAIELQPPREAEKDSEVVTVHPPKAASPPPL